MRFHPLVVLLFVAWTGCTAPGDPYPLSGASDGSFAAQSDPRPQPDVPEDDPVEIVDGPDGFIGSACVEDADCDYPGGLCLFEDEGFPRGMCSQACDEFCPDASGHPTTFCVDTGELPEASSLGDGACLSRCDLGLFPEGGCRTGYGCGVVSRANDADTLKYACLPDAPSELTACHLDLADRGVPFEPTLVADRSPSEYPNLTCHIEEPVVVGSRVHGVDIVYGNGTTPGSVTGSCEMAHSLVDTIDDVKPYGVETLRHLGTYNCRTISGTSTLSQHAHGAAIDISGFDFDDGRAYTLVDDWEHDTSHPSDTGGSFLYDAAYRWHDDHTWNIILTPNYNSAHDDHFHVDLTPGSDYIRSVTPGFIGPAPYDD